MYRPAIQGKTSQVLILPGPKYGVAKSVRVIRRVPVVVFGEGRPGTIELIPTEDLEWEGQQANQDSRIDTGDPGSRRSKSPTPI